MHEFGTTSEQLANIAVQTRQHASTNPFAVMRDPIEIEDVLNSRSVSTPLHLFDCCLVTDGGGCVVVVSPELAKSLPKPPVWLLGQGESHSHAQISELPDLTITPAAESGKRFTTSSK